MLRCPACRAPIRREALGLETLEPCPVCRAPVGATAFPAVLLGDRQRSTALPQAAGTGEATCFFHDEKRAVASCERCGRFVCQLCDIDLRGEHVCPACVASGRKKGRFKNLENERTLYDRIALLLATIPILMWPFTLITAPIALYIVIRYWKEPCSLVRGSRIAFIVAALLAALQVAGWITLLVVLLNR